MEPSGLAKELVKARRMNDAAAVARELAETPTARLARKLAELPDVEAATAAAESPTAQLARKISESSTAGATKQAASLGDDLAGIRRQLAAVAAADKANTIPSSVAQLSPQLRVPLGQKRRSPILPGSSGIPSGVAPPSPQKIDTEGLFRRAKEIFAEGDEAKRELDLKMVETMENMHTALVEANDREAAALDRAEAAEAREVAARERAEGREQWMLKMTAVALIFGALTVAAAVVTIIATVNAGS